jgi:ABC-2 type transport system permease protein
MLADGLEIILGGRVASLVVKELRQILRDKQQLFMLLWPPIIQICLYGAALSPDVHDLKIGIADECKTYKSRELVSALVEGEVFRMGPSVANTPALMKQIEQGKVDAGLVIPPDFDRLISQNKRAPVQLILDAVDANTAGIAQGYATQMINAYSQLLARRSKVEQPVAPQITYIYNPGLITSWFFVPGVMGLVLGLTGSLVSSVSLVKEKDSGTLEQLLMTPATSGEILISKVIPLLVLLYGTVLMALFVGVMIFNLPFRGSLPLYLFVSGIYMFVVISIGIILATISKNQRQAILTSFFFNLPLIQLSGAISPIESMPQFFRYLTYLNPLRYYIQCIRNIVLRGVGLDVMWRDILTLMVFAALLFIGSATSFRKQLD